MTQHLIRALALSAAALALSAPALAQDQRAMTPEDLATLSRVAAPATSADGRLVAWQQTETDPVSFARSTGLWLIDTGRAAAPARRVADIDGKKETSPVFGRDGMLYFLGNAG